MNQKLLCLALAMFISSSSSADYYPVHKTPGGYEPARNETFESANFSPGFIDTLFYFDPHSVSWYYPNRDSNTIVMQLFKSEYACSLMAVGTDYYSAGWAEFYVWEAPHPLPATTEELTELLYANWDYDSATNNWDSWPTVLYGPDSIGSDGPGDRVTRWCWVELDPKIDIKTSYVWVGYRIIDRYNPEGVPFGGKPWTCSDCWVDPRGMPPRFEPCRTWMYIEQPGHSRNNQWISYGNEKGDWAIMYVIDIYDTDIEEKERPHGSFSIFQSTPSPFTQRISVRYELAQASNVHLVIYNLLAQEVKTLLNEEQTAGLHTVIWDGRDNSGRKVPSGTYFLRLEAGDHSATRKVCVVR